MKTMDLKSLILKMFRREEFYGYDVHKRLMSENIKVEISRLYKVLNEMLREGLLEYRWKKSQFGPKMKVYRLSEKGREELNKIFLDAIQTVHNFYGEYLMSLPPKINVFDSLSSLLTGELEDGGDIVYIVSQYSLMHELMIRGLHGKVSHAKIYLVKPSTETVNLNLENLTVLNGTYDDIPLKDSYADIILVAEMPQNNLLENALKEWCRVLKRKGKVTILVPTVLVEDYEDPLTIGDFIEKNEHEIIEKGERIDKRIFQAQLKNFFQKTEERQIIHMTIFSASEPRSLRK